MVNTNHFSFVNPSLLDEIYKLRERYDSFSKTHVPCSIRKREGLRQDAIRHSVEVELVGYDTRTESGRVKKRRDMKENEANLFNALQWGITSYHGELTEDFILGIGERVEPGLNDSGYRLEESRPNGRISYYTSPEKIIREMGCFLFQNSCLDDCIDKGINAHLHLVRIHPFSDGNGRLSRLAQNIILEKGGFFPVTVSADERRKYLEVISGAVDAYKQATARVSEDPHYIELKSTLSRPTLSLRELAYCKELVLKTLGKNTTPDERKFYDYMAEKLRDSYLKELSKVGNKK